MSSSSSSSDSTSKSPAAIRETGDRLVNHGEKVQALSRIRNLREDVVSAVQIQPLIEPLVDGYREAYPDVEFGLDGTTVDERLTRIGCEDLFDVAM